MLFCLGIAVRLDDGCLGVTLICMFMFSLLTLLFHPVFSATGYQYVADMNINESPERGSGTQVSKTHLCLEALTSFYLKMLHYLNDVSQPVDAEGLWGRIEKVSI